jgi:hypothetical protein
MVACPTVLTMRIFSLVALFPVIKRLCGSFATWKLLSTLDRAYHEFLANMAVKLLKSVKTVFVPSFDLQNLCQILQHRHKLRHKFCGFVKNIQVHLEKSPEHWGIYHDCIKPIIEKFIPEISQKYAAGLIGPCSDVLGNDDEYSRDHVWGPRIFLFLPDDDHMKYAFVIDNTLNHKLPLDFIGFPTRFEMSDIGSIPSKSGTGFHHICITTPNHCIQICPG